MDTPEFRGMLDWVLAMGYRVDDEDAPPNIRGLVAHINVWGAKQREAFLIEYQAMERGLSLAIKSVTERAEKAEADAKFKQACIDRLMLEFCPDEMTPEQMEEWGKHQVRVEPGFKK